MATTDGTGPAPRRALFSWCLFDWANSPQPTIIVTFVFSAYFAQAIVGDEIEGARLWSTAVALSGLGVAVLSPILGAIADQAGPRKPWILFFSTLCLLASAMLWFATPDATSIPLALIGVAVASLGFEFALVFYNAMLPGLAPPGMIGRVSGWGWGIGYIGAIFCLILCLFVLVEADPPPFGLNVEAAEHVRATVLVVVVWWIIFGWPFFVFVPDVASPKRSKRAAITKGLQALWHTLISLREQKNILTFLIARMFYADGLATLFQFGGLYAAGVFGMSFAEIIQFGIAMNLTAGLGAFCFAWLDDRAGSRLTIIASLVGLIGFGAAVLVVESQAMFWVFGLSLSLFIGPVQSASRTLLARLAPPAQRSEMFGLYALSGKSTSFLGPLLYGWMTVLFESQRAGMATVIIFWLVGLAVLMLVREQRSGQTG